MRGVRVFLMGAVTAALAACGGDGGGLEDKALSDLSAEENEQLCEDYNSYYPDEEEFTAAVCQLAGIMAGEQGGDCEATIEACLADPPQPSEPPDCSMAAPAPDCPDVTVGELLECGQAQLDQIVGVADLSCGDPIEGVLDLPPECTALAEVCPDLFEDESAREILPTSALADTASQQVAR